MRFKKLLVICGSTATGKTKLATTLAKKFNGELISADSRQVYKGMDIGTGKDRPKGQNIWGYDLVSPKEEFSVSTYVKRAREKIFDIWQRNKLPVIVGGTGFYIKALIDGMETINVPRDLNLRKDLSGKDTHELQIILKKKDRERYEKMNESDRKNPRRLIRAIEIAFQRKNTDEEGIAPLVFDSMLMIGLKMEKEALEQKIKLRVKKRLREGFEKEVWKLLASGVIFRDQSMQAMGYRQYKDFFEKKITREEFIDRWIKAEGNYAKRQMVWFKKEKRGVWFDVMSQNYPGNVIELVERWLKS